MMDDFPLQFRTEFKTIIGLNEDVSIHSLMESWPDWVERILAYCRLEVKHRPKLKQLLSSLDNGGSSDPLDKGM